MPDQIRKVMRNGKRLFDVEGGEVIPPDSWSLLKPGDAALTRRVKKAGPHWIEQEQKGRRLFSKGVWAPSATINDIQLTLEKERDLPSYKKKLDGAKKRREKQQEQYVEEFYLKTLEYLNFHKKYREMACKLAKAVTEHATPVGSGTVARTSRIPVEKRAESAVIAWMRHETTGYDNLKIARVKGRRREIRRQLASKSKQLLNDYRHGRDISDDCPVMKALG